MSIKNTPEYDYSNSVTIEHRKEFAQFFTPEPIAELMASWLLGAPTLESVLEPAFGLGVFSRALLDKKDSISVTGYDIDDEILSVSRKLYGTKKNVTLKKQDYIYSSWNDKYDGIICNPPYFKFHDYNNIEATAEINSKMSLDCSGFTNLYALFLIKSVSQLKKGGRCAYIIPSEFMNSDYGVQIKEYLLNSGTLRHIIVFDFDKQLFDDAITTSAIVFCANDGNSEHVFFTNVHDEEQICRIEKLIKEYPGGIEDSIGYKTEDLDSAKKWKSYYQPLNQSRFINLVPFSTFAKVSRGIATGANVFFKFNREKAVRYGIPQKNLKPCICHCVDIPGNFFTPKDFHNLERQDKFVYIFDGVGSDDISVQDYVRLGVSQGYDKKHLTKNRTPWYSLEKRPPAPIWFSVFSRDKLHFVRNTSEATCLTTFHCVYPKDNLLEPYSIDLLFAYLLSDTARLIFLDNGREYGNGLSKFEPNDLNKGMMLDLRLLPDDCKESILEQYDKFKKGDEAAINIIDEILKKIFSI